MNKYSTGYIPDYKDDRDMKFSTMGLNYSSNKTITIPTDNLTKVKNQWATGSCVGHACSTALELAYLKQVNEKSPSLSALYSYYFSRREHSNPVKDAGTYPRTAIKALIEHGITTEDKWPFDYKKVNTIPSLTVRMFGRLQSGIRNYKRIENGDAEGIAKALSNNLFVFGGFGFDENFFNLNDKSFTYDGRVNLKTKLLHAMCIYDYGIQNKDLVFCTQNSWGQDWGYKGKCILTSNFIEKESFDLWALDVKLK